MKKSVLVLFAVVAIICSSCEKSRWPYYYCIENDLTDSLKITALKDHGGTIFTLAANEYGMFNSSSEKINYDVPEKFDGFLFTYKGKTYREDRRGGYSALNSAVYSKFTNPDLGYYLIDCSFVFNFTEAYLGTLPEVTD